MKKSEMLLEIAKNLGLKESIRVEGDLWGYGKIKYDDQKCIGCGKCEENCTEEAIKFHKVFDLPNLLKREIPQNNLKKNTILNLIKKLALKEPEREIPVPELVMGYGKVVIEEDKCIGCGNCERNCTGEALKVEKVLEVV
jgi:NAD-dependent dihydropyrimidine dehydrogenase PreA subunit